MARKKERPTGVTLIAATQAVNALATAGEALARQRAWVTGDSAPEQVALVVAIGAWGLLVAIGLWRLQRWAWTATMIWVGVVMALGLISYFRGNPSYSVMAVSVLQVFYLNQSDVQRAFLRREESW